MSDAGLIKRTRCAACSNKCRVPPSEVLWLEKRGPHRGWLHAARDLCPPCRRAQQDFWFARARRQPAPVQLRLVDAMDAPLQPLELNQAELSRGDRADLAELRRWRRAAARTAEQVS